MRSIIVPLTVNALFVLAGASSVNAGFGGPLVHYDFDTSANLFRDKSGRDHNGFGGDFVLPSESLDGGQAEY